MPHRRALEGWAKGVERGLMEVRGLVRNGEAGLRRAWKDPKATEGRPLFEAAREDTELIANAGGVHNPELAKAFLGKARQAAD